MASGPIDSATDPFSSGGGGTVFEHKVGACYLKDVLTGNVGPLDGPLVAVRFQPPDAGAFDDFELHNEPAAGLTAITLVQARYRQALTANNSKFVDLMHSARELVAKKRTAFLEGERLLLLALGPKSPASSSLRVLCYIAQSQVTAAGFFDRVKRSGKSIRNRLEQCRKALQLPVDDTGLYDVLSALRIVVFDLDTRHSPDVSHAITDLGRLLEPADPATGASLLRRLYDIASEYAPLGGTLDRRALTHLTRSYASKLSMPSSRRDRLHELAEMSRGRVIGRLRALNVPMEICPQIADLALTSSMVDLPDDPVRAVLGEVGAGKSTILERLHQTAIDRALEDPYAPIPLYLNIPSLEATSLEHAVEDGTSGLGDPAMRGAHVVLDGLDELTIGIDHMIPEAYALAHSWPNTCITFGTRPDPSWERLSSVRMEPLTGDAAMALIAHVSGVGTYGTKHLRQDLMKTLRRPLFAILYGLHLKDHRPGTTSRTDLVTELAQHAIDDLMREAPDAYELLVELAVRIVANGGHPVELNALTSDPRDRHALERSRLINIYKGKAWMQVAILTEWFAARRLLKEPAMVQDIAADVTLCRRWRYALAQAVSTSSVELVDDLLEPLVRFAPASAAWILNEATPAWIEQDDQTPVRSAREAGHQLHRAMRAWTSALAPACKLTGPISQTGKVLPLGVALDDVRLRTAWYVGSENSDLVLDLPSGIHPLAGHHPDWIGQKSGMMKGRAAWSWVWALDQLVLRLEPLITGNRLARHIAALHDESAWVYANHILGRDGILQVEPVDIGDLAQAVEQKASLASGSPEAVVFTGLRTWRLSHAQKFIEDLARLGIREIAPAWAPPDQRGSWVWQWWSPSQLLKRLDMVTAAALNAYEAIVDQWLPTFRSELPTAQLLPIHLVGQVQLGTPSKNWEEPLIQWYLEPAVDGPNSASWTLTDAPFNMFAFDFKRLGERVRHLRPSVDTSALTVYGGLQDIFEANPASRLARLLLHNDLHHFHWCSLNFGEDSDRVSLPPIFAATQIPH